VNGYDDDDEVLLGSVTKERIKIKHMTCLGLMKTAKL
jgi:hypothetical protein